MWQKNNGKWHLLLHHSAGVQDGSFLQTACGDQMQSKRKNQNVFNAGNNCEICVGVWHIVYTSVAEAKATLKTTTNLKVLYQAEYLTKSQTLRKAILSRIARLKKNAEKDRKLRLIQQAYD